MAANSWYREWIGMADLSNERANAAFKRGHVLTAQSNWLRAINYYQASAFSQRTKAALAAAKARGVRLGNPKGTKVKRASIGRARGAATVAASAQAFAERLRPVLTELEELSANAAAKELDRRGIVTARGGKWSARSIISVRARLKD